MEGLPDRVRRLRKERGLTSTALAKPKYTVGYISQIERGARKPSQDALIYLARKLGVSTDYLLIGVPDDLPLRLKYALEEAEGALAEGSFDEARRKAEGVITDSEPYDLPYLRSWAACIMGDALHRSSRYSEAAETYEDLLVQTDLFRAFQVRATAGLALASVALGNLKHAATVVESLLDAEIDPPLDHAAIAELHVALIAAYFEGGDVQLAQRATERALSVIDETVPIRTQALAYSHSSRVLAERGLWEEALDASRRARALMETLANRRDVARLHTAYAFLCLEVNPPKIREAETHLDQADEILSEVGGPQPDRALINTERGRIALFRRKHRQAIAEADRTIREEHAEELERGRAYFVKGRALAQLGRHQQAREAFDAALMIFGAHDAQAQLAATWREIGELAAAKGEPDAAMEAFRAALEAFFPRRTRP